MLTPEEHETGEACLPPNDNLDSLADALGEIEEGLLSLNAELSVGLTSDLTAN